MGVGDPNQKTVYHTRVLCSEQQVAGLLSTHNSLLAVIMCLLFMLCLCEYYHSES